MRNAKQLQSIELVSLQNTLDYLGISKDEFISLSESKQLEPHLIDGLEAYKADEIKNLKATLEAERPSLDDPSKAVDCLKSISTMLSTLGEIGNLFYLSTSYMMEIYKAIGKEEEFDFNRYDKHFQNLRNCLFADLHQLLIELPNHCD